MRDEWERKRKAMVEEQLRSRGIVDERVLEVMGRICREKFVPLKDRDVAYSDGPLPIGEDQTISQPYMVAIMTECLALKGEEKVLEIGTGSGYQAAILLELAKEVYTIERIPALAERAKKTLEELGYTNFHLKIDDGSEGWPETAPFDGIIVTAAAPDVPNVLVDQLADGGRLVIPIGSRYSQTLCLITKKGGEILKEEFTSCIFVPLIGEYGWKDEN